MTGLPRITVDRCLCTKRSFADLLVAARAEGWDLPALSAATGGGSGCGLCRPYLRRMLRTGETVFHELLREEPA